MDSNFTPPAEEASENNNPQENTIDAQPENGTVALSEHQLDEIRQRMKMEQNLGMGTITALVAALLCAVLWAIITVATKYQIAYMAVGVGVAVGYVNRYFGKGLDIIFGIVGAVFAFLGCAIGNYFTIVALGGNELGLDFFDALKELPFGIVLDAMVETFGVYDVLFYGIALYLGFKLSFRQITEEDLKEYV